MEGMRCLSILIQENRAERSTYYQFLLNLHYRLLAEDVGIKIAGVAGLLLLVLSFS